MEDGHLMARRTGRLHDVLADEARATDHQDPHQESSFVSYVWTRDGTVGVSWKSM